MNMESISLRDRVAPVAKSPLDSARGRRRSPGMVYISPEDISERMNEYLREIQAKFVFETKIRQSVPIK